jgi:hypothetical protein
VQGLMIKGILEPIHGSMTDRNAELLFRNGDCTIKDS